MRAGIIVPKYTRSSILLGVAVALCLFPLANAADTHQFDGSWEMEPAASQFRAKTVYRSRTIVFKTTQQGLLMRSNGISGSGDVQAGEFLAQLDGKYYPVSGNIGPDQIALNQTAPSTITFINRKSGKILATGRYELLEAGNRLELIAERETSTGKEMTMRAIFVRRR